MRKAEKVKYVSKGAYAPIPNDRHWGCEHMPLRAKKNVSKEGEQRRAKFAALFSIARCRTNFKCQNEGVEDNYLYNLALIV